MISPRTERPVLLAAFGFVLGVLGVVAYFVIVLGFGAYFPRVRNYAVPNWLVIAIALGLSMLAVRRARRRVVPILLLVLNLGVAAAFAAMLYIMSAVPPASGPPIGAPAPAFALFDERGDTVRLEDFRGAPLLLVFYRGHW